MTNEEIFAAQRKMRQFEATPLGAAFKAYDNAHGIARAADERSGWAQSAQADRAADKAWERDKETREALLAILMPLAGVP